MIYKVFSVYDSKALIFSNTFQFPTIGLAMRAFQQTVEDKNSSLNKYPEDFTLYEIADFDDNKGLYTSKKHVTICKATDFIEKKD
jgi:hypothetical protein